MANKIILRRDTAANWANANPVLSNGEIGLETDTERFKIGDGVEQWSERSYYANAEFIANLYLAELNETNEAADKAIADAAVVAAQAQGYVDAAEGFADEAEVHSLNALTYANQTEAVKVEVETKVEEFGEDVDALITPVLEDETSDARGVTDGLYGSAVPAGAMLIWPTMGAVPAGWLLADGSKKLRAQYPQLFALYSTTFNTGGELATEFRLPNPGGLVPVGYTPSQTEFDTLGEVSGSKVKSVPIGTANLPAHAHTMGSHTHTMDHGHTASTNNHDVNHLHTAGTGISGGHEHNALHPRTSNNMQGGGGQATADSLYDWVSTSGGGGHWHDFTTNGMNDNNIHTHAISVVSHSGSTGGGTGSTGSVGSGTALNVDVLQPSFTTNFIIKAG